MSVHQVERSALVTFSPEQMFDLVVDVERYCEFLPWVAGAEVHEKTERDLQASLIMERAGIRQSFTTRNVMQRPDWMSLELVNGPFKQLNGLWTFTAIGTAGTKVVLDMNGVPPFHRRAYDAARKIPAGYFHLIPESEEEEEALAALPPRELALTPALTWSVPQATQMPRVADSTSGISSTAP